MNKISNTQLYWIFTTPKVDYVDTAYGINELAKKLSRTPQSVKESIKRLGKEEFILKDKNKTKYLIICEEEMRRKT
jgi:predicted transcriptional regulator